MCSKTAVNNPVHSHLQLFPPSSCNVFLILLQHGACGISALGPGIKPMPLHWKCCKWGVLTTGMPRKYLQCYFKDSVFIHQGFSDSTFGTRWLFGGSALCAVGCGAAIPAPRHAPAAAPPQSIMMSKIVSRHYQSPPYPPGAELLLVENQFIHEDVISC